MKLDLKSVLAAGAVLCAGMLSAAGTPVAQATCDGVELNFRFEASAGRTIVNARGADDQIAWNNTEGWSCGGSDEESAVTVTAQGLRVACNGGAFTYVPIGEPVSLVDAQKGEGLVAMPEADCLMLVRSVGGVAVETVYVDGTGVACGPRTALAVDGLERPQAGKSLSISANAFEGAFVDEATLDAIWYRAAYDQVPLEGEVVSTGLERRFTSDDYEHWFVAVVTDRVGVVAVSDPVWFSKLPVVYITTESAEEPTAAKEDHAGTLYVQGNAEYAAQYGQPGAYADLDNIHVRGNTTAQEPKKPYKIKLGKKTDLFGMGKNKHWVLLANYLDPGLMRNKVLYDAANQLGCLGMKSVWVEVVLNGRFLGNYQLCEQLRIASGRVDIANWEDYGEAVADAIAAAEGLSEDDTAALETLMSENFAWVTSRKITFNGHDYDVDAYEDEAVGKSKDITGGYLFEFDKYADEASMFQLKSGKLDLLTKLNMPEFLCTNPTMMDFCQAYLTDFFDAVQAEGNCDSKGRHYTELADIDAMAGYWLAQELAANSDSQGYSRFAYKDQSGKLVWGPIWDLDHSVGYRASEWTVVADASGKVISCVPAHDCSAGWHNGNHYASGPYGDAERAKCNFYPLWCDDPYFCLKLWEHWQAARNYLTELVSKGGTIDKYYDYLLESGNLNYRMWPVQTLGNATFPFEGEQGNAQQFKRLLKSRIQWIDTQMASLERLVASLNNPDESCADHPYVDSSAKFDITVNQTARRRFDSKESSTPDVSIVEGENFSASVAIDDADVTTVDVYVNGIFSESCQVVDKKFDVTVEAAKLTVADGRRNMVSFVARRGSSAPLRAYALVTKTALQPTPFDESTVVCTPEVGWDDGYSFTGEGVRPVVTVTDAEGGHPLVEGRDYTVSYLANVYPGEAKVILMGTGNAAGTGDFSGRLNWVGTIERTFTIKETRFAVVTASAALDTRDDSPRAPEVYQQLLPFAYTSSADWPIGGVSPKTASIVITDIVNGGDPKILECPLAEGTVSWYPRRASTYRIALLVDSVEIESCLMEISEKVIETRPKRGIVIFFM